MSQEEQRIVLTGFMGVGKSTVARHLSYILRTEKLDLDEFIEKKQKRSIPEIVEQDGVETFRQIETEYLKEIIEKGTRIISLGGGAWLTEANRDMVKENNCTSVWLESTFEHCWRNISMSKKVRPLVKNKDPARELFEERVRFYCLAEWHFVVNPGFNSFEIAKQISSEVFSL